MRTGHELRVSYVTGVTYVGTLDLCPHSKQSAHPYEVMTARDSQELSAPRAPEHCIGP